MALFHSHYSAPSCSSSFIKRALQDFGANLENPIPRSSTYAMAHLNGAVRLRDLPYAKRYLLRAPWAPRLNSSSLRVPCDFLEYSAHGAHARVATIYDDFIFVGWFLVYSSILLFAYEYYAWIGGSKPPEQPVLIHADVSGSRTRVWEMLYFEVKIIFLPAGENK